ncbi:MAG: S-ribosylhomocysteine lyase, partial [Erysipelotrichaceae bacterium]|nr:S-ribosylhomocysteine lyase [Erysipelotrichaceae bacterium]
WGPMGCLTGFYLIVKGRPAPQELLPLLIRAFEYCAAYDGDVPGATPVNCGNYVMHDLNMARWESNKYLEELKGNPGFEYTTSERLITDEGMTFYDS